jgi:hypothetical protein
MMTAPTQIGMPRRPSTKKPSKLTQCNTVQIVPETDLKTLQIELARSREARLRTWAVLQELRGILTKGGQELPNAGPLRCSPSSAALNWARFS